MVLGGGRRGIVENLQLFFCQLSQHYRQRRQVERLGACVQGGPERIATDTVRGKVVPGKAVVRGWRGLTGGVWERGDVNGARGDVNDARGVGLLEEDKDSACVAYKSIK